MMFMGFVALWPFVRVKATPTLGRRRWTGRGWWVMWATTLMSDWRTGLLFCLFIYFLGGVLKHFGLKGCIY